MYYCKECQRISSDNICSVCGSDKLNEPHENDPVYLTKRDYFESGILEEILEENKIPFEKIGEMGEGMTLRVGIGFEYFTFYVPYGAYKYCTDIINEIFSNDDID